MLLLRSVTVNLPVLAYGASIGWMSPMSLLLQSKDSPRGVPLTDIEVSWMAAMPYLICVPANSLNAYVVDKFGRKTGLYFVSLAGAASWIFLLISYDLWALILARSLVGVIMSGSYVICPIYTKEISDDSIRGSLGCFEATKAIAWLRCKPEKDSLIQEELNIITNEQEKDKGGNEFLLTSIWSDKTLRKAFEISMVTTLAREVCGAIPVMNFAGEIFTLASTDGIILSPNQQAMLLGAVQVLGSILASSVVDKSGRKPLLFVSSFISGLSMCVLASWFLMRDYEVITPSWIPLLTLCICIFCDSSGLQPISMVLMGEIFSFKYRGTVMATTMSCSSLADFFQLLFFKPLANSIGIHVAFYFFGLVCLSMAAYVILVIPETKARSLEDIYKDLAKKQKSKKDESTGV
ncbi:unnamed protein product, partial [Brenthis ino]